jgi:hypothetical protein
MKEIVAMEAFGTPYMTQAEDLPINERGYWTRIAGVDVTADGLRGATAEEKTEWQAEMDKLMPIEASVTN